MPDIEQARAAYAEAWATAGEAVTATMAGPSKRMDRAMAMARASQTPVTRQEIAAYLTAWGEAEELARNIRAGAEADLRQALGTETKGTDE